MNIYNLVSKNEKQKDNYIETDLSRVEIENIIKFIQHNYNHIKANISASEWWTLLTLLSSINPYSVSTVSIQPNDIHEGLCRTLTINTDVAMKRFNKEYSVVEIPDNVVSLFLKMTNQTND